MASFTTAEGDCEVVLLAFSPLMDETEYINCGFLMPTSNIMERFFSDAGYADVDLRQNLLPMRLEQQHFLKFKKILECEAGKRNF